MNQETLLKALVGPGLTERRAGVHIFLATKAPQKATDIANALKMNKQWLYLCLRNLRKMGIINCTGETPTLFSAVPIEEALSAFIRANLEKAQQWR